MKTNREAILETALEIVAFEGIGEMTLSNLAERLGVQKSAIYHWYKSKREIIEDIFETGHRNLMAHSFQLSLIVDRYLLLREDIALFEIDNLNAP